MTITGTVFPYEFKVDWGVINRNIFISSIITTYNISRQVIDSLFKSIDKQYGNLLTEDQKKNYINKFCENRCELCSHPWGETYLGTNDVFRTQTITYDQLQWTDSTYNIWG